MPSYPTSTYQTSRGFNYTYIHISPSDPTKPYLLFLHGFPSSANDFRYQIDYFSENGYGVVVPDMLGYGGTSKPKDVNAFTGKAIAADLAEILKKEGIRSVVGIGHDWGSFALSRLINFYPALLSKVIFLDIGYQAPGVGLTKQTINFVNGMVKEKAGYEIFGYFLFFDENGAVELMDKNVEAVQAAFHSKDEAWVKEYMGATGGMRKMLAKGEVVESPAYLSAEEKEHMKQFFSSENGGYGAAINWYRAQIHDINAEDEKAIPKENHNIQQPTLLISSDNFITVTSDMANQMRPFVKDFREENLHTGHWIMLEKPKETNQMIEKFITG